MDALDMHLFDTNALIYYLAGEAPHVKEIFRALKERAERLSVSVISKIELLSIDDEAELAKVETLLGAVDVLGLDDRVVEESARVRRAYKLKLPDAIIAATALTHGYTLVTRNLQDFGRVGGLDVVDPKT